MSKKFKPFTDPVPAGFVKVLGTDQYYVSVNGEVASTHYGRWHPLSSRLSNKGYPVVCIYNKKAPGKKYPYLVHVLMAEVFFGPSEGRVVNHLDANPIHNSLFNLEYCTQAQNIQHAFRLGTMKGCKVGVENHNAKLSVAQIAEIWKLFPTMGNPEIAALFGVTGNSIRRIRLGLGYVEASKLARAT